MIKKAHKTKTKRYHPFHLRDAFYWDLNNSFQSGLILCLIIQLFIYWITIFSTQVAMEKIKGSVKLLKSTCEIEKWNKIIHSRDYFRIAWQFFSGHGKNIRSINIVCIIWSSYSINFFIFRRKMGKGADWNFPFSFFFIFKYLHNYLKNLKIYCNFTY